MHFGLKICIWCDTGKAFCVTDSRNAAVLWQETAFPSRGGTFQTANAQGCFEALSDKYSDDAVKKSETFRVLMQRIQTG